ncbi:MAG: xanthine dehydrogenase family protein subunit M [Acidobacteriota bacterium]|nr:xanthine dehydrogenase family protein subunit M [Acidobacteriota bacterium]
MYASDFAYYRADSVAEVGRLLRKYPGAKLLAGGHSLIPLLKLRLASPSALIDIGRLDTLKGISVTDGGVRIGALTTHAEIAASSDIASRAPALSRAAGVIGDPAVRNRGTIGGNVAHADPASDLPTVLVALEASIVVATGETERTVPAGDFFQGMMTTALGEQDLVTAIEVPAAANGQGQAYEKFSHPASRYAVIGVAATVSLTVSTVSNVAVALGGLVPAATRAGSVERALSGQAPSAGAIAAAAATVSDDLGTDLIGDIYASAEYRRAMAPICVKRALTTALGHAFSQAETAKARSPWWKPSWL